MAIAKLERLLPLTSRAREVEQKTVQVGSSRQLVKHKGRAQ